MAKKLKVGFDFDGVIAYNPLRVARLPATVFKGMFLRQREKRFFIPKSPFQRWVWGLLHESSFLPAPGITLLTQLVKEGHIEAYLISGRFGYLEPHLQRFLKKKNVVNVFKEIHVNVQDEQPHEFKKKMIDQLALHVYVEDNWDIVGYLISQGSKAKIYWITNFIDRFIDYEHKYTSLKAVLKQIIKERKCK